MLTVTEMQEYVRSRTTQELEAEFKIYKAVYHRTQGEVFTELLAIELDSRQAREEE